MAATEPVVSGQQPVPESEVVALPAEEHLGGGGSPSRTVYAEVVPVKLTPQERER